MSLGERSPRPRGEGSCLHLPLSQHPGPLVIPEALPGLVDREEPVTGDGSPPSIAGPNLPDLRVIHHDGTTGAALGALGKGPRPSLRSRAPVDQREGEGPPGGEKGMRVLGAGTGCAVVLEMLFVQSAHGVGTEQMCSSLSLPLLCRRANSEAAAWLVALRRAGGRSGAAVLGAEPAHPGSRRVVP